MDIFRPKNINEWLQRMISFRVIFVCMMIVIATIFEIRFYWVEQTLGAYLITTNSRRPRSGKIWESGLKTISAQHSLGQIVSTQQASRYNIQDTLDFNEVFNQLALGQHVMASPDHFRRMYTHLPLENARQIMRPINLIKMIKEDQWQRVLYKKSKIGLEAFFLDGNNQTLEKVIISHALLQDRIMDIGGTEKRLDQIADYKQIITADRFFEILESLPDAIQDNFFVDPKGLVALSGHIKRFGLTQNAKSGIAEIGIEIENGGQVLVIRQKCFESAIKQFRAQLLEEEKQVDSTLENDMEMDPEMDMGLKDEPTPDEEADQLTDTEQIPDPYAEEDPETLISPADTASDPATAGGVSP